MPKAGPCWFLELCFSCLLHQISSYPDAASRDRAPPLHTGGQPAARPDAPRLRACGGPALVLPGVPGHSGSLYRAPMIRPGFWFHFGRLVAKQILPALSDEAAAPGCRTPAALRPCPFSAGQGTLGPSSGPTGPRPGASVSGSRTRLAQGSSGEGGRPAAHTGAPLPGAVAGRGSGLSFAQPPWKAPGIQDTSCLNC